MFSISEILIIQLLCFTIVYSSPEIFNKIKEIFPFFNANFSEKITLLLDFLKFIGENNPLLIDYYDKPDSIEIESKNEIQKHIELTKPEIKFEDKYLEKFKNFPNEFSLNELELKEERDEYEKIKLEFEKTRSDSMWSIKQELSKISELIENGGFRKELSNENELYTDTLNSDGINKLLEYCDMIDIYEDDPDDIDFEELYKAVMEKKEELLKNMIELENKVMTDDEMRSKARDIIINKKLDKYIDNYVLEQTPLGNIYMRYNNNKKSFEYFSNNTIPYRYLEPVGRKYVITYWCKPIFVDIEEELKKAEAKYEDEKKKKAEEEKQKEEENKKNPKKILAQLKNYNKDTKDQTLRPMKNRSNTNTILPPQIQANLPDVNKTSEKQLLKENANRYTWEGRLTNFCPLKKVDRKILDKKLAMTYAEFKKMQQEQQNKK